MLSEWEKSHCPYRLAVQYRCHIKLCWSSWMFLCPGWRLLHDFDLTFDNGCWHLGACWDLCILFWIVSPFCEYYSYLLWSCFRVLHLRSLSAYYKCEKQKQTKKNHWFMWLLLKRVKKKSVSYFVSIVLLFQFYDIKLVMAFLLKVKCCPLKVK